jgi:dolichol-phosphate mannosyltransferase
MPLSCLCVMPAYNEEGNIARVVADWSAQLASLFGEDYAILVVNDGSRDATGATLDALAVQYPRLMVHHQVNQGHGAAVMNAYRLAIDSGSPWIFQTDSDDQFDAADFGALWGRRSESKFILGFRRERHDSAYRLILSKLAGFLVFLLFFIRLKDSNVPYRLMEREFLRDALPVVPAGAFAPNICLSIIAAGRGQKLLHIPVRHRKRVLGKSIVNMALVRGCVRSFKDLLRLRAAM